MTVEAKFLTKEKDFVEVQLEGVDEGLARMLVEKLAGKKSVSLATVSLVHPLIPTPVVRVRAGEARKELADAVEELQKDVKDALKSVEKL